MMSRLWRRIEGFDLDFRPHSYFWPLGLREHLLATVKGTARRAMLADYGYGQEVENDAVAAIMAAESVSEPLRRALGRIHPMLMSGEYLPDLDQRRAGDERIASRSRLALEGVFRPRDIRRGRPSARARRVRTPRSPAPAGFGGRLLVLREGSERICRQFLLEMIPERMEGKDRRLPICATERVLDDCVPQPGDMVSGTLWLQGRILGVRQ